MKWGAVERMRPIYILFDKFYIEPDFALKN